MVVSTRIFWIDIRVVTSAAAKIMINLFLAVFWLSLGGLLIGWHWLHPEFRGFRIWGSDVSLGWFALLLALYNVVRWLSNRRYVCQSRLIEESGRRGEQGSRETRDKPNDPNFKFDPD
jgi:hypothetical protein